MGFLSSIFTWWSGATLGTRIGLGRYRLVGADAAGNRYYEGRHARTTENRPRRWVIYNGANDSSRVPAQWHGWLHGSTDDVPGAQQDQPGDGGAGGLTRSWQKDAQPNLTGSGRAHHPAGALASGGIRARATGDYEPWNPVETPAAAAPRG